MYSRLFRAFRQCFRLVKMSSKHVRKDSIHTCVVCCEDIEFYATGACDHTVCYKCCVRMRVLGREMYCAVCRTELDQVNK